MSALLPTGQARALGAPTRRAIVTYLEGLDRPATVAELSANLGLNHNGVRKHLAQLLEAGLVVEEREARTSPGRPRLLYRLSPGGPASVDQPYRRLAVLLATTLATAADPETVGRQAAVADPAGTPSGGRPVETLALRFAAEGFEPAVRARGGRTEIVLGRCPFMEAARVNAEAVCRLHLGLAQGAAEAIGGLRVEGLVAKDPIRAGCRLTVSPASTSTAGSLRRPSDTLRERATSLSVS